MWVGASFLLSYDIVVVCRLYSSSILEGLIYLSPPNSFHLYSLPLKVDAEFPEVSLAEGYVTRRDQLGAKAAKKAKGKGKGKGEKKEGNDEEEVGETEGSGGKRQRQSQKQASHM